MDAKKLFVNALMDVQDTASSIIITSIIITSIMYARILLKSPEYTGVPVLIWEILLIYFS